MKEMDTPPAVEKLLGELAAIEADGWYPAIEVQRPWSQHNPTITGEFSGTHAIRRYLERELGALITQGALVAVRPSRPAVDLESPAFFAALDEAEWDLRQKKLFLFSPERMALSLERVAHYTGTAPELFQRYVVFTNYAMHVEAFRERFPDARWAPSATACRCRRGTTSAPRATASPSSTSASAPPTRRRSPITSPSSARTPS